jgi:Reverse transcriptase (RNA-dependent DNA polymerase)
MIESLILCCMIDAMENLDIAACNIPAAFKIHIKFEGELVDLLVLIDPSYTECILYKRGKKVVYALLNKALYRTVQASLLFWMRLSAFWIEKHGFKHNPYNHCVVNKVINRKQCTIVWYVNDLKISHMDDAVVVGGVLKLIEEEFGMDLDVTFPHGKVHDYLGMRINFSQKGKVIMSMFDYIDELLEESPHDLMKGVLLSGAATKHWELSKTQPEIQTSRPKYCNRRRKR